MKGFYSPFKQRGNQLINKSYCEISVSSTSSIFQLNLNCIVKIDFNIYEFTHSSNKCSVNWGKCIKDTVNAVRL